MGIGDAFRSGFNARFSRKHRKVVYTCLFGHSERFLDARYIADDRTDFICFTDDETLQSDFWTFVLVPKSLLDPHRLSKRFKHRPHFVFPEYAQSLYIDNTVTLKCSTDDIFDLLDEQTAPMMMFRHPDRQCVYEEAEVVKQSHYDDARLIDSQMQYYRDIGYPERNGLHAATVLLRNHRDEALIRAMDEWHDQVLRHSKRDQLSFDVVRHYHGLSIATFDGNLNENDIMNWPVLRDGIRLPRDFDKIEYLALHPDVAKAQVDPAFHYLNHGVAEGRAYRRSDSLK